MLLKIRRTKKAQGATEYAIFIAAVLAGLLALQVYYSRSVKGNMKGRADSIGEQLNTEDGYYNRESMSVSARQSETNTGNQQGWTSNNVADKDDVDTSFIGGFRSKDSTADEQGLYAKKYGGGAISSTQYVGVNATDGQNFGTGALGTKGRSELGDAEASGSVWD